MENTKVISFELEESKVNKQSVNLIAIDETGQKWVVGGNTHSSPYAIEYEQAWDTTTMKEKGYQ